MALTDVVGDGRHDARSPAPVSTRQNAGDTGPDVAMNPPP